VKTVAVDPSILEFATFARKALGARAKHKQLESLLSAVRSHLSQLSYASMVNGRCVPADVRRVTQDHLIEVGKALLDGCATTAPDVGRRLANDYAMMLGLDLATWLADHPLPDVDAFDLESRDLEPTLAKALRQLSKFVSAAPRSHRLERGASEASISRWEKTWHVKLPDDLAVLYRLCNGCTLFRDQPLGSPFTLIELDSLQTAAEWQGEPRPRPSRRRTPLPDDELAETAARIKVFSTANGDFLSWATRTDGSALWIDDWRERASPLRYQSVAQILTAALKMKRVGGAYVFGRR
jgi:hypothetical protein